MVDEENVGIPPTVGDLPEGGGEVFGGLAGVGENQRFFVPHAVVHILVARIKGSQGRGILPGSILACLQETGVLDVEMLHPQPPAKLFGGEGGDVHRSIGSP